VNAGPDLLIPAPSAIPILGMEICSVLSGNDVDELA